MSGENAGHNYGRIMSDVFGAGARGKAPLGISRPKRLFGIMSLTPAHQGSPAGEARPLVVRGPKPCSSTHCR
jgi:hypothetical protein